MRYQSTVFGQLLKAVPRGWFERQAHRHRTGRAKRVLSPWGHLVTMVLAQIAGLQSLRDLERVVERHPGVLAHLGLDLVRRSTLSDANASRPAALFEAVAHKLAAAVVGRRRAEAIRLIDATRLFAGRRVETWTGGGGVKLHVIYDPCEARATCFAVTPERVNDITAAKAMPIESGATYVFDKAYYDFAFWAKLDAAGCRFVTRLKTNSPTHLVEERVTDGDNILFDRLVTLSQRLSGQRRNPYGAPIRLVGVRIDTGRELILVTNDLSAPAADIADLYKTRWQIELFFKWIKQNLKLAHFLGATRNAVTIQIMAALIGFLLLRIVAAQTRSVLGLQAIARLLPATLLVRRPCHELLRPPELSQPKHQAQIEIAFP